MKLILLVNTATTLFLCGLIWLVQVVHYPLFDHVGREGFSVYENAHTLLITPLVGLPMFIELGTAFLLVVDRPSGVPALIPIVGLALVGVVWLSTIFIQVPLHGILSGGFDQQAYQALVGTNWIRTLAWTVRATLVLWMIAAQMK